MTGSDIMRQDSNLVMPVPEAAARQKRDCSGRFLVAEILSRFDVTPRDLARYVGSSLLTVVRWARGDTSPGPTFTSRLAEALYRLEQGELLETGKVSSAHTFASRGARRRLNAMPLFQPEFQVELEPRPLPPMLSRLQAGGVWGDGAGVLASMLADHAEPASTADEPVVGGVSAGKNTYTYDAHTYHTKVPPQGIAEILRGYLPTGGIVLDPFAGSGMTGVAACALSLDVVLNELSPAASFIADRFTRFCDPDRFEAAVDAVRTEVAELRRRLYTTHCRECGEPVEILFTIWSYRVLCTECDHEFLLWDHCRRYGKTVRDHRILGKFPCPVCGRNIRKSRLRRTVAAPVRLGYQCCSKRQVEHPLTDDDLHRLRKLEDNPPLVPGFYPATPLPEGVNLCQPRRHGLTSVDGFYTGRNLAAMSHLWHAVHRVKDDKLAGFLAFTFTSLYKRVTRLSEFRFWGGSGNTANLNVPYIFNEANVFVTFERKARTILNHLDTTAGNYTGRCVVRTGTATDLHFLPDSSIDLVFTDPPFGANINYSEMNFLWEAWLGVFTDTLDEAIINRRQGKTVEHYETLMTASLRECHRVLRPGHWLVVVFMNSSHEIWNSIRNAVITSGFSVEKVDIFDKQHGTFKQFVSENTAGCDLMLHCRKAFSNAPVADSGNRECMENAIRHFLESRRGRIPTLSYLHVSREDEIDYRMLYSEFLAANLTGRGVLADFSSFRTVAAAFLEA